MPLIEVVYEHGMFRPLEPVSLAEGSRGQVSVTDQVDQIDQAEPQEHTDHRGEYKEYREHREHGGQQPLNAEARQGVERGGPLVGEELAALLDQIADLPHAPHPDGRTDISTHHDDVLYPKYGRVP